MLHISAAAGSENAFACLPVHLHDSFLTQAFQQLDEKHLFSVAALVCHHWHSLALSSCSSISLVSPAAGTVRSLKELLQHCSLPNLRHLNIFLSHLPTVQAEAEVVAEAALLYSAVTKLTQLQSLESSVALSSHHIHGTTLSALTNLTKLAITSNQRHAFVSISALTNLRHLTILADLPSRLSLEHALQSLSTSLVNLTSLEIITGVAAAVPSLRSVASMAAMPSLQQLFMYSFVVKPLDVVALQHLPLTHIYIMYEAPSELNHVQKWLRGGGGRALKTLGLMFGIHFAPLLASIEPHEEVTAILSCLGSPECAPHLGELWLQMVRIPPTAILKLECLPKATAVVLDNCQLVDDAASRLSVLENVQFDPRV